MSEDTPLIPAQMKVVELREELARRDLETKGLKKDLVDRLTAALDLSISGGSTTAPLTDEVKDSAVPLGRKKTGAHQELEGAKDLEDKIEEDKPEEDKVDEDSKEEKKKEDSPVKPDENKEEEKEEKEEQAVGHTMVEGTDIDLEKPATSSDIELEPASLDPEVAAIVAQEEAKSLLPPSPPIIRSMSPLPASRKPSPSPRPISEDRDMSISSGRSDISPDTERKRAEFAPTSGKKRSRSPSRSISRSPSPRQKRRTDYLPLPSSLSHLIHPPTCTLYITNLRRPLVHSALHDHLFPDSTPPGPSSRFPSPRQPFAGESFPALWLSGVKDHAYATFLSEQDALEAAERIEGVKWPEDTGGDLHVEFIQDDLVRGLVEEEERAWLNGRQKLGLEIKKVEGEYEFRLTGGTQGQGQKNRFPPARPIPGAQPQMGRRPVPVAVPLSLSGANAGGPRSAPPANAPSGPSRLGPGPPGTGRENFNIRGRGGFGGPAPGSQFGGRQPMDNGYPVRGGNNGYNNRGGDNDYGRRSGDNGYGGGRDERNIRGAVVPPGSSIEFGLGDSKNAGRLVRPLMKTKERPYLTYREGPGATVGRT